MKCWVLWLFLALGTVGKVCAAEKGVATGKEPAWIIQTHFREQAAGVSNKEASGGYLYILQDEQVHVGEKTRYQHYTRKILTEAGIQYGSEIGVGYDPDYEKLIFHHITIYRDGKPLNRLSPAAFKILHQEQERERFIYNNSRTAVTTLEDVRVGDVIDYAFSVIGSNPIHPKYADSFSLNGSEVLDQLLVRVLMPTNRPLKYKVFNSSKKPQVLQTGNLTEYRWQQDHIPGISLEDNTPAWYTPYASVYFSEYNSWQEVADWALQLFSKPVGKNAALENKIAEFMDQHRTDEARLAAALKFVQDEVRYLGNEGGIYGYQPNDPAAVFTRRYGDCKDKALLLCHMLQKMHIKASPVLVNTSRKKHLAEQLPNPYAFDHCVVQVQLLNQTYMYDATISQQGGTFDKIYFPNYGLGLVIEPGTKALAALPVRNPSKIQTLETFTVGKAGEEVYYHVETKYSGDEADYNRGYFASTNQQEIEKNYLNFYASAYPEIKAEEALVFNDHLSSNEFTTYESYILPDFWQKSEEKKEAVWVAELYPMTLNAKLKLPSTRLRKMPLALEYPLDYEHVVQVQLPSNWNVDEDSVEIKNTSIYFKRAYRYNAAKHLVTIYYRYQTLQPEVAAADMKTYFNAVKKIQAELGYQFTSADPITTDEDAPFSPNWFFLVLGLLLLGAGGYAGYRAYQYDPAPQGPPRKHPADFDGWLILVAIGLPFTPLGILISILQGNYFSMEVWNRLANPESAYFNPMLRWVLGISFVYNVLLFCFSVLLAVLFFQKRSSLPRVITIFYVVSFIGQVADAAGAYALGNSQVISYSSLIGALVGVAVWLPYFNLSKRVKRTFTVQLNPPEQEEEAVVFKEAETEQPTVAPALVEETSSPQEEPVQG